MSTSTVPIVSETEGTYGRAFWERLWRTAGLQSAGLFVIAWFVFGHPPQAGAPGDVVVAFYDGERVRILIAASLAGLASLNLMWFAAAVRTTLAEAGQDGWGAAATASSAAVGGLLLLFVSLGAALAYSIAGSGHQELASGLNDLGWACFVLTSFPRAMLIMSTSLGLWRAKLISNAIFTICVVAIVLVLAGGTTWFSGGVWAPDGVYSRFVSPILGLVWIVIASQAVLRSPAARTGW